ncbi:Crp/Fnr family transcriptional regulator [Elizabethkingia bruuniana]|uniref:Crp/Fnr family transcriptional regulator n=1 Tax=Elizabethkingia bruuniana TaxID=1756149 RepID=UPI00099A5297|nr:Crp/Fnr family transcriptional regulator [Elizabethkingia bruuniana]OPC66470.1 Crp/Fnr family transcriptional regulator [Elizabethkingia bruuniana]
MNGQQKLSEHIQRRENLTEDEVETFVDSFAETKIKKRQFIVQPDFTAQYRHYIVEGAFRAYVVGDGGNDHTISFAIEDWWITDYNSYIYQQPATMFVVALEDSIILRIPYEQEQELKKANHKFETIFRNMAERGLAFQQRRMIANLTLSAEERYDDFLFKYPHIVQRLPQYALASYLGMTTEFLSKIRNNKVRKKS